jgi:hypothetical protein
MDVEEFLRKVKELPPEEQRKLKEELRQALRELKVPRPKKEVPSEAKALIDEYWKLKDRLSEIRKELAEKYNITPAGTPIRKGYGNYDYRGTPAYEAVKEIIKNRRTITVEELEDELKTKGYRGITGTIGVVIKNLKEDGLITRQNNYYVWVGGE